MTTFTEAELFNCCEEGLEPSILLAADWDWLEVHGCALFPDGEGGEFVEQVPDAEAQFWSVYGHYHANSAQLGLECVTDGPAGDRERAYEIAAHLGALWALPIR